MSDFLEHFKKYLRLGMEIVRNAGALSLEVLQVYVAFLWRSLITLTCIGAALLSILAIAWLTGVAVNFWLFVFLTWVGIEALIMALLASPLLWAGQQLHEFPSIQRTAKTIASVAFWGMLLPFISLQPGIRSHPETIVSLLGIISLLAVGTYAGIVWLPERFLKRVITTQLLVALFLTILSIKFPNTINALRWGIGWGDVRAGQFIAGASQEKNFDNPETLVFVNDAGDPLIYGAKEPDGLWRFRDGPGFLPSGREARAIVIQSERDEVRAQVQARYEKRLADEAHEAARQRAEELARQDEDKKRRELEREEQERQNALAREVADQQYRLAHVRPPAPKDNGSVRGAAVLITRQGFGVDRPLTDAVVSILGEKQVAASGNVLLDVCTSDGVFDRLYDQDGSEIARLRLEQVVDHLVLGRSIADVKGPLTGGLFKATINLEARLLSTKTGTAIESFTDSAEGVAMIKEKAEERAREELMKKLNANHFSVFSSR